MKKASPGCNPGALSHPFLQRKGCPRRAGCPNSKGEKMAFSKESGQSARAGSALNKKENRCLPDKPSNIIGIF
jgi:hypothetical protein